MRLGVIGYGKRIRTMIRTIQELDTSCRVAAITDVRNDEIRQQLGEAAADIYFADTPEEMLEAARLDGILIGTRCNLHAEMACKVLESGIPLFLEKPVATTLQDLRRLKEVYEASGNRKVVVSFPLRVSPMIDCVREILDAGKIGTVEHVQAWTNVHYGGVYFHDYAYRDEAVTGGLFLQKATHDFDYINAILGRTPMQVCAMTSKQVMKGDKPAGLKCVDCEERKSCPESRAHLGPDAHAAYCCFSEDTGNEDSGSALIRFDSGMHVSYTQNFLVRRKDAASRGARLIGYKGSVEFDFTSMEAKVYRNHTPRVEIYKVETTSGHMGGDAVLAQNFIDVMNGRAASLATMESGLLSALMCLKAKQSAMTASYQDIRW